MYPEHVNNSYCKPNPLLLGGLVSCLVFNQLPFCNHMCCVPTGTPFLAWIALDRRPFPSYSHHGSSALWQGSEKYLGEPCWKQLGVSPLSSPSLASAAPSHLSSSSTDSFLHAPYFYLEVETSVLPANALLLTAFTLCMASADLGRFQDSLFMHNSAKFHRCSEVQESCWALCKILHVYDPYHAPQPKAS